LGVATIESQQDATTHNGIEVYGCAAVAVVNGGEGDRLSVNVAGCRNLCSPEGIDGENVAVFSDIEPLAGTSAGAVSIYGAVICQAATDRGKRRRFFFGHHVEGDWEGEVRHGCFIVVAEEEDGDGDDCHDDDQCENEDVAVCAFHFDSPEMCK
jgi:hypothetical protein